MLVKYHSVLLNAVIFGLLEIFGKQRYADKVVEHLLKSNKKWGKRDRAFIAENTYNMVRWWRLVTVVSATETDPLNTESVAKRLAAWFVLNNLEIPAIVPNTASFEVMVRKNMELAQQEFAIKESIPDWLAAQLANELPHSYQAEVAALNQQAPLVLRANTLKGNRKQLQEILTNNEYESHIAEGYPDALVLHEKHNVFGLKAFQEGLFEVQDASSQRVAYFTKVEPGMRVIDACAGAGGKTLHLAALMQNKGKIIAMDAEGFKLEELKRRARRAGAFNIETRAIEGTKTIKKLESSADVVLLDVPCSGLGVIKRNPDAKWKLTSMKIETIKETQRQIIDEYSQMVKPGGMLIYATCSILPSENEAQVERFLGINSAFELEEQQRISPSETGFDGFYMARMRRKK